MSLFAEVLAVPIQKPPSMKIVCLAISKLHIAKMKNERERVRDANNVEIKNLFIECDLQWKKKEKKKALEQKIKKQGTKFPS